MCSFRARGRGVAAAAWQSREEARAEPRTGDEVEFTVAHNSSAGRDHAVKIRCARYPQPQDQSDAGNVGIFSRRTNQNNHKLCRWRRRQTGGQTQTERDVCLRVPPHSFLPSERFSPNTGYPCVSNVRAQKSPRMKIFFISIRAAKPTSAHR
eukprot:7529433-Pyramimonas_sp.AAC.1